MISILLKETETTICQIIRGWVENKVLSGQEEAKGEGNWSHE